MSKKLELFLGGVTKFAEKQLKDDSSADKLIYEYAHWSIRMHAAPILRSLSIRQYDKEATTPYDDRIDMYRLPSILRIPSKTMLYRFKPFNAVVPAELPRWFPTPICLAIDWQGFMYRLVDSTYRHWEQPKPLLRADYVRYKDTVIKEAHAMSDKHNPFIKSMKKPLS